MLESLSKVVHHDEYFEFESNDEQEEYDETTTASTSENEKSKEKKIRTIAYELTFQWWNATDFTLSKMEK